MSKSLKRVQAALNSAGITADILEMPAQTRTAALAADAAGCDIDQIAKSIIFRGLDSGKVVLFVTAGANSVCPQRASALVGEPLSKADAALIRSQTGFAIGGVSPIGHLNRIRTFFDPKLLEFDEVWAAAGTPRHIFQISPLVLSEIIDAQVVGFTS